VGIEASIIQTETGLVGLRVVGRVSSAAFIAYGVWMASAEVYRLATY
jgi:hypothetical protein